MWGIKTWRESSICREIPVQKDDFSTQSMARPMRSSISREWKPGSFYNHGLSLELTCQLKRLTGSQQPLLTLWHCLSPSSQSAQLSCNLGCFPPFSNLWVLLSQTLRPTENCMWHFQFPLKCWLFAFSVNLSRCFLDYCGVLFLLSVAWYPRHLG